MKLSEAFISGLQSVDIRQCLLESDKTDLTAIHSLARGLEVARVQAQSYSQGYGVSVNAVTDAEGCGQSHDLNEHYDFSAAAPSSGSKWSCWFCGGSTAHASREACPAFNVSSVNLAE